MGNVKEWVGRYGPAEIVAIIISFIVAHIVYYLSGNVIVAGIFATIFDYIGYYVVIVYKDFYGVVKEKGFSFFRLWNLIKGIVFEFGIAEVFDFFARPFFLSFFPILLSHYSLGVVVGLIFATGCYYFIVIVSYELRKRYMS